MPLFEEMRTLAVKIKGLLQKQRQILVLSESCTCGLLASIFGEVPGISAVFAGSAVTYRDDTKAQWLGVKKEFLDDPHITAVSEIVAEAMCVGVLQNTPEATISVSTTGHLGPDAPPELDGLVFVGCLRRSGGPATVQALCLGVDLPEDTKSSIREYRRQQAALSTLQVIFHKLIETEFAQTAGQSAPPVSGED